jgi:hypothetical protein
MKSLALDPARIPELSRFLLDGLHGTPGWDAFADEAVLRWKYAHPDLLASGPRSFMLLEQGHLAAHIGFVATEFVRLPGRAAGVPAMHSMDWLASQTQGGPGALLMLEAFARSQVQYALGCSESARRALLAAGFKERFQVPLFQKVLSRLKRTVWNEIHGSPPFLRRCMLLAADLPRTFLRFAPNLQGYRLRRVEKFGEEVRSVLSRYPGDLLLTSRDPEVLNHLLAYPRNTISGWLLEDQERVRGFGLLSTVDRPGLRIGRIVECFVDSTDPASLAIALHLHERELARLGCDMVSCHGSTESMATALRTNGFFRRGRTPFYLRDPRKRLPEGVPFHLTHLEADAAYT